MHAELYDTATGAITLEVNPTGNLQGSTLGTLRRRQKSSIAAWAVTAIDTETARLFVACKDRKSVQAFVFGRPGVACAVEKLKYPAGAGDVVCLLAGGAGRLVAVGRGGQLTIFTDGTDVPQVITPLSPLTLQAAVFVAGLGVIGVGPDGVFLLDKAGAAPLHASCPVLQDLLTRGGATSVTARHPADAALPVTIHPVLTTLVADPKAAQVTVLEHLVVGPTGGEARLINTGLHTVPWVRGTPELIPCPVGVTVGFTRYAKGMAQPAKPGPAPPAVTTLVPRPAPQHTAPGSTLVLTAARVARVTPGPPPTVMPLMSLAPLAIADLRQARALGDVAAVQYGRSTDAGIEPVAAVIDVAGGTAYGPVPADAITLLGPSTAFVARGSTLTVLEVDRTTRKMRQTHALPAPCGPVVALLAVGDTVVLLTSTAVWAGSAAALTSGDLDLRPAAVLPGPLLQLTAAGGRVAAVGPEVVATFIVRGGDAVLDALHPVPFIGVTRDVYTGAVWRDMPHGPPVLLASTLTSLVACAHGEHRVVARPAVPAAPMPSDDAIAIHPPHLMWDDERCLLRPTVGSVARPALLDVAWAMRDVSAAPETVAAIANDVLTDDSLTLTDREAVARDLARCRTAGLRNLATGVAPNATGPPRPAPPAARITNIFYEGSERPDAVSLFSAEPEPEPEPVAETEEEAQPEPEPTAEEAPEEPATEATEQDRIRADFLAVPADDGDEADWGASLRRKKKFEIKIKPKAEAHPKAAPTLARGLTLQSLGRPPAADSPGRPPLPPLAAPTPTPKPKAVVEALPASAIDALTAAATDVSAAFPSFPASGEYHPVYQAAEAGLEGLRAVPNPQAAIAASPPEVAELIRRLAVYHVLSYTMMKMATLAGKTSAAPPARRPQLLVQRAYFLLATWTVALGHRDTLEPGQLVTVAAECIAALRRIGNAATAARVALQCGPAALALVKDIPQGATDKSAAVPTAASCGHCGSGLLLGSRCSDCGAVARVDWRSMKAGPGPVCPVCGGAHGPGACQTCGLADVVMNRKDE